MNKEEKQRTRQQEKSYHKGFQEIADICIENGKTLAPIIEKLQVRPTASTVKDLFRHIAELKYGVKSTKDLRSNQVNEVWEDLQKAVSEGLGIYIPFPSIESQIDYEQFLH